MVAWVREEENVSKNRQKRKREAEDADEVEVTPGVAVVASLRRFRAALAGSTQELPKRCRLCR